MLGRRESFYFPDRGGDHTTVLKRKYFLSILVLKPVTSVRWIQRFRFY